jgi:hypothetical protein
MRTVALVLTSFSGWGLGAPAAHAADAPAIVIPGRPDVPVIINGVDVSYAVVEGDWGLDRPGAVAPTIIGVPAVVLEPRRRRSYLPMTGEAPERGRYEIEPSPTRLRPRPAPSFYRERWTESKPTPATQDAPYAVPEVYVAPQITSPRRLPRRPPG